MKLATKLSVIFALLSILSIATVGYQAYRGGRKMIIANKQSALYATVEHTQAALERWIENHTRSIEILSAGPFFADQFEPLIKAHDPLDSGHMRLHNQMVAKHLAPLVASGAFEEILILRPADGLIVFSTDKKQEGKILANRPFFTEGRKQTYVQTVYYSMAHQRAAMTIATPVKNRKGELTAVMAGHIDLAALSRIMKDGQKLTKTQDTYLVNKFNFLITEPRFGDDYALKKSIQTDAVNAALAGRQGIGLYRDYREEPVIGVFRWVPRWELAIISEIDQAEAFAPIHALRDAIAAGGLAVAVVAALVGWLTALSITRPLQRLTEDVVRLGKGTRDFAARASGKDEVGDLTRAFSRMTRELDETLVSRETLKVEIAERRTAEAALRESETRFRTIADTSPLGIFIIRQKDLTFAYVNPALCRIFGYDEGELIDRLGPMALTHPEDHPPSKRFLEQVAAKNPPGSLIFRGLPKNGDHIIGEVTARSVELEGDPMFIGTLFDATDRVRAKEQLEKEKAFSDTVINSLPGVFYLFDEKTLHFRRWNRNFETVTGYSAAEIESLTPLALFDEEDAPRVAERIGQVFRAGYATVEADFLTKTGERVPHFFTGHKMAINKESYLIGTGIDVTAQKAAREALAESENRFRRLAENAKDMIYRMMIPEGRYEYVSPAAEDLFGYPPEVFYEKPLLVRQTIHPAWEDYFKAQWENLLHGNMSPSYEYQIIDAEGRTKWLNQRNVLILDEAGQPAAIEGIVTDVTELKRVAEEQIRLEKFVVLGRVAAGVAHELNNPLMGVLNYAQYCREETPENDEKHSILEDIETETQRCIRIVQNLLGASRIEDSVFGAPGEIAAEQILERVVRLMEYRTGKENVAVDMGLHESLPKIRMNGEAFQQLCLNLLTNAVDAVEDADEKRITLQLAGNGDKLKLTVADTGCGIPDTIRDKIFDPFFTTKDPGKGTGLGLATCWKIVHQQGGSIQCNSNGVYGTVMTVTLPVEPKANQAV